MLVTVFAALFFFVLGRTQVKKQEEVFYIPLKEERRENEFSAWIPYWDKENVDVSFGIATKRLKSASPFWYKLNDQGRIEVIEVENREKILTIAGQKNSRLIPTIGNDFDGIRVKKLLEEEENILNFLSFLKEEAVKNNYFGWEIDWEEIKVEDRGKYVFLIKRLAEELHLLDLVLLVDVHARFGFDSDWEGALGHDYQGLGKYADQIVIMAYDFHNSESEPGPITPLPDLIKTIEYSIRTIPLEKIVIGLPLYGYDWSEDLVVPVNFKEMSLIDEATIEIERDGQSGELMAIYEKNEAQHTVWYQDKISLLKKIEVANFYGLTKFKFWRLGGEDLSFWD